MTEHEKDQERNDLHPTQEEVVLALLAEWASGDRDPHDPRLLHASKEMLAQAKVEVFVRLACDAKDAVIFPELLEDAPENVLTPAQRERLQNEAIPLFLANNGGDILKRFDLLRRYGIDVDEAMRTPNAREAALGSLELRMMTADVPSEWKEYAEALQMTQEDMRHAAARAMLYISDKRRLGELNTYGVTHEDSRSAAREIVEECVERGNVSGITAEFLNRFSLPDLFSSEQMDALYARIEDHAVRLLHSGKARDVVAILEMHRLLPLKNDISERRNLIEPLRNILAKVVEEEAINTWGSLGGARTFRDFEEERSKWGGTQRLTFTNVDELLVALAPTSRTPEDRAAFAAYYSARLKGMDGLLVVEEDIREGKVNELFS